MNNPLLNKIPGIVIYLFFLGFLGCKSIYKHESNTRDIGVINADINRINDSSNINQIVLTGVNEMLKKGLIYKLLLLRSHGSSQDPKDPDLDHGIVLEPPAQCRGHLGDLTGIEVNDGAINAINAKLNTLAQDPTCFQFVDQIWAEFGLVDSDVMFDWFSNPCDRDDYDRSVLSAQISHNICVKTSKIVSQYAVSKPLDFCKQESYFATKLMMTNGYTRTAAELCLNESTSDLRPYRPRLLDEEGEARIKMAFAREGLSTGTDHPLHPGFFPHEICWIASNKDTFNNLLNEETSRYSDSERTTLSGNIDSMLRSLSGQCEKNSGTLFPVRINGFDHSPFVHVSAPNLLESAEWKLDKLMKGFSSELRPYKTNWSQGHAHHQFGCVGLICSKDIFDVKKFKWSRPVLSTTANNFNTSTSFDYYPLVPKVYEDETFEYDATKTGIGDYTATVVVTMAPFKETTNKIIHELESSYTKVADYSPPSMNPEQDEIVRQQNIESEALFNYLNDNSYPVRLSLRLYRFEYKGRGSHALFGGVNGANPGNINLNVGNGFFTFLDYTPVVEFIWERDTGKLIPLQPGTDNIVTSPLSSFQSVLSWGVD